MPPRLASDAPTLLRKALERSGLSQAALARALDCDRRQVQQWVTGEYTPVPARREQIAAIVGSTSRELWPDADEKAAA
ncbi:MAG TPA: helix-turn-helix transcriptional regulator [Solirubrobacteraceae bacterium]